MNISGQLRNYRKEYQISQEELAEIIHVSRQTISNWENDKSYPDIQSLMLMSEYFKISLDELVKGDIANMKDQLRSNEIRRYAMGMGIGFVLMILSVLIAVKVSPIGYLAAAIFWGMSLWFAIKVEKIKKDNNLVTYREIVAYMENGRLPQETSTRRNSVGYKIIFGVVAAVFTWGILDILLTFF